MNIPLQRSAAMLMAVIVSCAGLGLLRSTAVADEHATLDHGSARTVTPDRRLLYHRHVDAAHVAWNETTDAPTIVVIDGQDPVPADSVYIRLGPDADEDGNEVSRMAVPKDPSFSFLGKAGDIIWSGPQVSYDNNQPVWAGLGAGEIPADAAEELDLNSLRLQLVDLRGPGKASTFTVNDGKAIPVQNLDNPTTWMRAGSHGHYFWGFTKPGRYEFDYQAIVDGRDGGRHTSPVTTVTWLVGPDAELGFPPGTTKQAHAITKTAERQRDEMGGGGTGGGTGDENTPSGDDGNDTVGGECLRADTATLSVSFADDLNESHPPYADAKLAVNGRIAGEDVPGLVDVTDGTIAKVPSSKGLNEFLGTGSRAYRTTLTLDTTGIDASTLRRGYLAFGYASVPGRMVVTDADDGDSLVFASTPRQTRKFDYDLDDIAGVKRLTFWFDAPGYYAPTINIQLERKRLASDGAVRQTYADYDLRFAVGNAEVSRSCAGVDIGTLPHAPEPVPPSAEGDAGMETDAQILSAGHLDVFHTHIESGELKLAIREDVTGAGVIREPERTLLFVRPDAWTDAMPAAVGAEGDSAFLLPLTQDDRLLWPGWDTNDLRGTGHEGSRFEFVDVDGPGDVLLYTLRGFADYVPIAVGGETGQAESRPSNPYALAKGSRIVVKRPAHNHAYWAFAKPGVYTMKVRAVASGGKGELVSRVHTYTWKVGGTAPVHVTDDGSNGSPDAGGAFAGGNGEADGKSRDDRRGSVRHSESRSRKLPSTGVAVAGVVVAVPVLAGIGAGIVLAVVRRRRSCADGRVAKVSSR